jgi:hypothetical protein
MVCNFIVEYQKEVGEEQRREKRENMRNIFIYVSYISREKN